MEINIRYGDVFMKTDEEVVKKLILDELNRLAKTTGYPIDKLKIEFKHDEKSHAVAYFSYSDKPIGFCFDIRKHDRYSINKVIDTVNHEFAHYMAFMKYGSNVGHGPKWQAICRQLGANPSPYLDHTVTKHY